MKYNKILSPLILFAFCGKPEDVAPGCDTTPINLSAQMYAVRIEALSITKDPTNPFLVTELLVKDPATGVYPLAASLYYPVKLEWMYNSLQPNYEVIEGVNIADSYKQTVGPLVIANSETATGKLNVKALNSGMWALVGPLKGAVNPEASLHIYGVSNGLKFLPIPTTPEFGNRVAGNFASITGGEESTPNGVNWLDGTYAATIAQFNDRLEIVV